MTAMEQIAMSAMENGIKRSQPSLMAMEQTAMGLRKAEQRGASPS
ncbi:hypothetical protein [uncultured Acetatifactor sp.]|nr:hypothetical protein [uncultured Acetatifactor sp.]